jgi:hypothetical protein
MEMRLAPITLLAALSILASCAGPSTGKAPSTQGSLKSIPVERGTADYWFKQPAVASVTSADYRKLWDACAKTLRDDQFEIDQQDYRDGILMTWPMVSKQALEIWRSDAGTAYDVVQDTLQTIRRSVRFEFSREPNGLYVARPKVLIEQSSHPERRLSTVSQAPQAFTPFGESPTRTTEEGAVIPNRYWFVLGRDEAMERQLANSVREKLRG